MVKSQDISNRSLATLLVVAIVISIGGTYVVLQRTPGITGLFTGTNATGTISFTQQGVLSIRLDDASTTFGNVTYTGAGACTVDTEGGSSSNCAADSTSDFMVLENDGNVNAVVTVNTTGLTLGTGGSQSYRVAQNGSEANACVVGATIQSAYATLPTSAATNVCSNFTFADDTDSLKIHYNLTIGDDLTPGNQSANVTFWASLV